jgi:hypothetical protein
VLSNDELWELAKPLARRPLRRGEVVVEGSEVEEVYILSTRSIPGTEQLLGESLLKRISVQGVGFRPFVYRLAHEHDLRG